jgi:lysophospholipase L1-like esterase
VIAPTKLGVLSTLMAQHYEGGRQRSADLPERYRKVCAELRCRFFDANEVVSAGDDGVHLNFTAHRRLAEALAPVVRDLLDLAGQSTKAPGEQEC